MTILHATTENFQNLTNQGVTLVDFWAPWCGPCKMIAPVLEELDTEIPSHAQIVKVDIDECQELAAQYGIMSVPSLLILKDGEVVDKAVGYQPKEMLTELLSPYI